MPGHQRSKSHWGRLGASYAASGRAASPIPDRSSRRRMSSLSPKSVKGEVVRSRSTRSRGNCVGAGCGGDRSQQSARHEEGRRGRKHWGEEDETDTERKRAREASSRIRRAASPSSSPVRSSRRRIESLSPKIGKGKERSRSRGNGVGCGGDRRSEKGRRGRKHKGEEDETDTERKTAREAVEVGYDGDLDSGDTEKVRGEKLSDEETMNALRKVEKEIEDMVGERKNKKKGSEANSHRNVDCSSSTGSNPEDSDSTGGAQKLRNLLADWKGEAVGTNNNNLGEALRSLKVEKLSPKKQEKLAGLVETARRLEGEKDLLDRRVKALEAEETQLRIKLGIL